MEDVTTAPISDYSQQCSAAAHKFKNLKLTIPILKADYHKMLRYINNLVQLRSGFYCSICSAEFQSHLGEDWFGPVTQGSKLEFTLGSKFCRDFSDMAMPFVQYTVTTLKDYLETGVTLMECEKVKQAMVAQPVGEFDIETWEWQMVGQDLAQFKTCHQRQDGESVFTCKGFCELFDMTTPNHLVDGDLEQLRNFVKYFHINKVNFTYPQNNFIVGSASDSEYLLDNDFKLMSQDQALFAVNASDGDPVSALNRPNTVVLMEDGADLFEISKDNDYAFFFESAGIWRAMGVVLMLGVLQA